MAKSAAELSPQITATTRKTGESFTTTAKAQASGALHRCVDLPQPVCLELDDQCFFNGTNPCLPWTWWQLQLLRSRAGNSVSSLVAAAAGSDRSGWSGWNLAAVVAQTGLGGLPLR